MLTSSGLGAISSVRASSAYHLNPEREAAGIKARGHTYDQITLSTDIKRESAFQMELISRLSQEVRTATTTGDIQALRQLVSSGQYQPDPMAIAARMLFQWGEI